MRQIGNAVPVQLAHALGKELGRVVVRLYRERESERSAGSDVQMDTDED